MLKKLLKSQGGDVRSLLGTPSTDTDYLDLADDGWRDSTGILHGLEFVKTKLSTTTINQNFVQCHFIVRVRRTHGGTLALGGIKGCQTAVTCRDAWARRTGASNAWPRCSGSVRQVRCLPLIGKKFIQTTGGMRADAIEDQRFRKLTRKSAGGARVEAVLAPFCPLAFP